VTSFTFTYLGCRIDDCGGSEEEILRRIKIARGCMKSLTKNIWRSSITHSVKIQLYNTSILPVLLYGSELWDVTVQSGKRLDAFDQWCLRHILQIPFTAHVTNQEVRIHSAQPPVTQTITARRLRFFGHIVRSDSDEDHTRALNAGIDDPPKDWRRPRGRPRQTWLRTVENDLNNRTWVCGLLGTEHITVNCGVKSWKRQRSC